MNFAEAILRVQHNSEYRLYPVLGGRLCYEYYMQNGPGFQDKPYEYTTDVPKGQPIQVKFWHAIAEWVELCCKYIPAAGEEDGVEQKHLEFIGLNSGVFLYRCPCGYEFGFKNINISGVMCHSCKTKWPQDALVQAIKESK